MVGDMITQYPHYLFALLAGSESVQDSDGDWIPSETIRELISVCREETNGRGSEIQVAGGIFHRFASLVQLPKAAPRVEVGTSVFIANNADGSSVRITGSVLKFDAGQIHSRLWI
ncbi:MAG: hypothetical protein EZS26_002942 [Candidatus Ordinivivax streblomastigis]|uniref:Uncharacterized protein n=1 Tax=Candidatus Ordinivivax streblomastigis TaxID=2540710 RepID=A0A5M8NVN1_9BACT|nr:MAG: hypothetical protein EZS26_002942 [Candidatus Ordinivivax streblomastigis]